MSLRGHGWKSRFQSLDSALHTCSDPILSFLPEGNFLMLQTANTLFSPFSLRGLTLKNRLVVAPMCQYSAKYGVTNDWHFAHLGRFGIGGFGLVIVEAAAVTAEGRISYADVGLWSDDQTPGLQRIVDFLHSQGAAAGIQLAHAGRKASTPVPFRPSVEGLTEAEKQEIAYESWQPIAPSAVIHSETAPGFSKPREMTLADIESFKQSYLAAVARAHDAGFDIIEIHAAHGYLLNQFLSPLANKRTDEYGGSRDNRMRLLLELSEAVRKVWHKPLSVRISATDNHPDGWTLDDSVALVSKLKEIGVDVVDCSSGGFDGAAFRPSALYQVPLSAEIRAKTGMPTMAVGLITKAEEAAKIIADGEADLVALAREALDDPNWPVHAKHKVDAGDTTYAVWPQQAGYAVKNKDRSLKERSFAV
jgi:2,4-dienoyl-CoA reductase-like NADH-dependent reductase (Old Yellow Enzyme family)